MPEEVITEQDARASFGDAFFGVRALRRNPSNFENMPSTHGGPRKSSQDEYLWLSNG